MSQGKAETEQDPIQEGQADTKAHRDGRSAASPSAYRHRKTQQRHDHAYKRIGCFCIKIDLIGSGIVPFSFNFPNEVLQFIECHLGRGPYDVAKIRGLLIQTES